MRHPPPCEYDSSITATNPDSDFCTCPRPTKNVNFRAWIADRIASVNGHMLQCQDNVPEAIALSGQLTAYKQMLNYAKTHGIA